MAAVFALKKEVKNADMEDKHDIHHLIHTDSEFQKIFTFTAFAYTCQECEHITIIFILLLDLHYFSYTYVRLTER